MGPRSQWTQKDDSWYREQMVEVVVQRVSEMNTFAGFWRDGAVVRPTRSHLDTQGRMTFKRKINGEIITIITDVDDLAAINMFHWLDTTTPTELTPQEAFEVYKIVYPDARRIEKAADGWRVDCGMKNITINWGSTIEYPPRERWRVPTDADKGNRCRFKDREDDNWRDSGDLRFFGYFGPMCFAVEYDKNGFFKLWKFCEVLE